MNNLHVVALSILTFLLGSLPVFAERPSWLQVLGNLQAQDYYKAVNGRFIIDYFDENLPWGTEVVIHYGFSQSKFVDGELREIAEWVDSNGAKGEVVRSIGPYKWGIKIDKTLYFRGAETQLTNLNFYLEITLPSGEVRRLPDGGSAQKFYSVERAKESLDCDPWGERFCSLNSAVKIRQ